MHNNRNKCISGTFFSGCHSKHSSAAIQTLCCSDWCSTSADSPQKPPNAGPSKTRITHQTFFSERSWKERRGHVETARPRRSADADTVCWDGNKHSWLCLFLHTSQRPPCLRVNRTAGQWEQSGSGRKSRSRACSRLWEQNRRMCDIKDVISIRKHQTVCDCDYRHRNSASCCGRRSRWTWFSDLRIISISCNVFTIFSWLQFAVGHDNWSRSQIRQKHFTTTFLRLTRWIEDFEWPNQSWWLTEQWKCENIPHVV